jgi:hypothetical protein
MDVRHEEREGGVERGVDRDGREMEKRTWWKDGKRRGRKGGVGKGQWKCGKGREGKGKGWERGL